MFHTTYKRTPFNPIPFINILNDVANSTINDLSKSDLQNNSRPKVNIAESEENFSIILALPGYKKEDVQIKIENDKLQIFSEKEVSPQTVKLREFSIGKFNRHFLLPDNVDKTKISASLLDGLLTITINKLSEAKPYSVEVK